ncbi:hypothetical protein LZ683_05390 [Comamonas testosteroni]|uniref:hypothetical protein n=1 Tax=Comamonas testosteroni TaxID=285 RepID=UPI0023AA463F|nr:hypothetical protein [Comamonas testosteroni]WEE78824.1 hypothetical protein LZ683_05390 [Comamonas testosteroni]
MSGEMGTGGLEQGGDLDARAGRAKELGGQACAKSMSIDMPDPNLRKSCDYWHGAAVQLQFLRYLSV